MITKARDGAEIPGTWEGMGRLLPKPSENVTEIHSKRSLSRGIIFDFVSDLKFRRKAMLQLALSFLLFFGIAAIVTSPAPPFAHKLAHRIDLDAVELAVAFIVLKLVLIGIGYLAVGAFDDSNREIVTFQLAYWQELKSAFAVGDVQWYLSITNIRVGRFNRIGNSTRLSNNIVSKEGLAGQFAYVIEQIRQKLH